MATILAARFPPSEGPPKQPDLIILFDPDVLQIFRAAGTGDALPYNRKHLIRKGPGDA